MTESTVPGNSCTLTDPTECNLQIYQIIDIDSPPCTPNSPNPPPASINLASPHIYDPSTPPPPFPDKNLVDMSMEKGGESSSMVLRMKLKAQLMRYSGLGYISEKEAECVSAPAMISWA